MSLVNPLPHLRRSQRELIYISDGITDFGQGLVSGEIVMSTLEKPSSSRGMFCQITPEAS
jgi:hypothetical protein